jgi:16S rRNA (cytidine1402-2'-O)-methyltransferase
LSEYEIPVIFYEAPHRIMKTLESLKENLDTGKKVIIARELTKMFEEVVTGSAEEVFQYFIDHPDRVRGEFVVLVD